MPAGAYRDSRPSEIEISKKLTYDEQPKLKEGYNPIKDEGEGKGFNEKKEKNNKVNKEGVKQGPNK